MERRENSWHVDIRARRDLGPEPTFRPWRSPPPGEAIRVRRLAETTETINFLRGRNFYNIPAIATMYGQEIATPQPPHNVQTTPIIFLWGGLLFCYSDRVIFGRSDSPGMRGVGGLLFLVPTR